MKSNLLIAVIVLLSINNTQAQLPNGSVAPDFTLVDLNGTSHNLYAYLNDGYTVFIDFSAVWCPPCWSYHTSGALEDLYMNHGPAGMPNVSASTTDDIMVFFIEGDEGSLAQLNGGSGSQGDWVTGTPYPIIPTYAGTNSSQISTDYAIAGWPTVYMVCPDRLISETGQSQSPYSFVNACLPPASNNDDARTFDYAGETVTCEGNLIPEIMIQNYGITNLTSLSIEVKVNGTSQSVTPWTGLLNTYATGNVTLPALIGLANNDAVTIEASLPNGVVDQDPSNNPAILFNVTLAIQNTNTDVTVQIVTDQYGSETTWDIKDANGMTVLSGGPYGNLTASGTAPQAPVITTLSANTCHTFTIYDSYGDGINTPQYGAGSFTVTDGSGTILVSGGVFMDEDKGAFKTGGASTPSWDCDGQGTCSDPGTGLGLYSTAGACQTACVPLSLKYEEISNLSVYPNPSKNTLTIDGNYTSSTIYTVFGKAVLTTDYQKNIDVTALSSGVYFIHINTKDESTVKRITIAK